MMPPVISALLAFMAALFRSRASLYLEHLVLQHQLAVYRRSVPGPLCSAKIPSSPSGRRVVQQR
jgi:hypothetical protein